MEIREDYMIGEAVERLLLMGAHYMESSNILTKRQPEILIVQKLQSLFIKMLKG